MTRLGQIHALLLSPLLLAAQTQIQIQTAPPDTPVGHWVAEHTSQGGIGSWWDFRPNGTLTMHMGAVVSFPIKRSGDTFIQPAEASDGPPVEISVRIEGDTLHLKGAENPEQTFTRVGPAPSPSDPLLGKWRPVLPANPHPNPDRAALQKAISNGLFIFSADSTESVRIPFTTFEGTWDAITHTFRLQNRPGTYTFHRTGSKLTLGQPPDGHQTDTYLPDPVL